MATLTEVKQALEFACKMTGLNLDETEQAYYLRKLKGRIDGGQLIAALDQLIENGTKPTLKEILKFEKGAFDDAETAFAKAVANLTDESQTCLMNEAIAKAWSVAAPLHEQGMNYDAGRAFKSAYEAAVSEMKLNRIRKPKWFLSIGTDKQQREQFIREQVSNGLLAFDEAVVHLPHLTKEEITDPSLMIENKGMAGLIENLNKAEMTESEKMAAKEEIKKLRKIVHNKS
jgi:hypothetical protein